MEFASHLPSQDFMSSSTAPQRDHKVVRDGSTVAALKRASSAKQIYRSEEQAYNDHRQATGYVPQGPLSFGQFEVGRGSMPQNCFPTRQFTDVTKRLVTFSHPDCGKPQESGDPGAYDPYEGTPNVYGHATLAARAHATHNRMNHAFGSTSKRNLNVGGGLYYGQGVPGPGKYRMSDAYKKLAYKALNPAHSAFKSKSLQRPYDDHPTPGPGTHTPNFTSVEANMRDSGNSFRSENVRSHLDLDKASHPDHVCGAKSMTSPVIGPGAYYNDHNTLQHGLLLKLEAQSKTKPGFGAKAPARCLPFEHHQNGVAGVKDSLAPGPGDYQPSIWTGHALGAPGGKVLKQPGASRTQKKKSGGSSARSSSTPPPEAGAGGRRNSSAFELQLVTC